MQTFLKPLSEEEEAHYLALLKGEDEKLAREAKEKLIMHNLRLVAHISKKYQNSQEEPEELISIGTIGLIKAIATVNAEKGRLSTYAARCIENEILMLLRSNKKYQKEVSIYDPIGTDKDGETVNRMDVLESEGREAIELIILEQDVRMLYRAYAECLNETEKTIIRMRYGLWGTRESTQREIAGRLGISRSYVSRIEKRAIGKLREGMKK